MRYLIGAGTYAAFDDSIGLRIVEHVAEKGLERGFSAVDLSAGALALMPYLDKTTEHILLVDTAKMGLAPGSYLFFAPEQVVSRKPLGGISTHEDDILKVLELARATGHHIPPITLMASSRRRSARAWASRPSWPSASPATWPKPWRASGRPRPGASASPVRASSPRA